MDKRDAPETQHGPARRLVEEAFDPAVDAYIYAGINDHLRAEEASKRMDALLADADQHDAAFAALVQAAQTALDWMDIYFDGERSLRGKLRAALNAVRTEADSE